jgi:hypothetical protein
MRRFMLAWRAWLTNRLTGDWLDISGPHPAPDEQRHAAIRRDLRDRVGGVVHAILWNLSRL